MKEEEKMTDIEARPESRLCSVLSRANGEDPIGSATPFERCLLVEVAAPWEDDVAGSRHFPKGLWEVIEAAWDRGLIDKFAAVLPDVEYSREGYTRFLYFRRPPGPFAAYEKDDFLVPDAELVPVLEALFTEPDELSRFESYRQSSPHLREIMVCTHGSRDACCGKFGYPFYGTLRYQYAAPEGLRVWRVSHIGGHRFAPTLMDLPEGRYWGHLEPQAVESLVLRDGPASELRQFYRGWAGLGSKFEQIAEREILAREGWGWTGYLKEGRVLAADEDHAEVRIEYESYDGRVSGAYEAAVGAVGSVMTLGSSGTEPLSEAKQYEVSRLEKVSREVE
jgi:hypothetical protein